VRPFYLPQRSKGSCTSAAANFWREIMKTLMTAALVAAAVALPSPAFAVHTFLGMQFDSRGECESFLKQARNDERRDRAERDIESPNDFNSRVRDGFFCDNNGNGKFTISRTAA
jgi:hypothetical protein